MGSELIRGTYRVEVEQLVDVIHVRTFAFDLHFQLKDPLSEVGWQPLVFSGKPASLLLFLLLRIAIILTVR
jgi:hypothetical protein